MFEERSVKERKKSSLEELLSEGGKDDMSVTPVIGVDCEMVEVVGGLNNKTPKSFERP